MKKENVSVWISCKRQYLQDVEVVNITLENLEKQIEKILDQLAIKDNQQIDKNYIFA